jgi:SNF2 family DNA or RNA helicase
VARGTLEERIAEMQRDKRALTDAVLAGGGATSLARADLAALYHQLV